MNAKKNHKERKELKGGFSILHPRSSILAFVSALSALFAVNCSAPVVTGTLGTSGPLIFTYQRAKVFNGVEYGVQRLQVNTMVGVPFATNLPPGDWKVEIGPHRDLFLFTAPNDTASHDLFDLINGSVNVGPYVVSPAGTPILTPQNNPITLP